MAFRKAKNQVEKGRLLTGIKAIVIPSMPERKARGYLIRPIIGRRKKINAITIPPANWRNCFRVISPTSLNS